VEYPSKQDTLDQIASNIVLFRKQKGFSQSDLCFLSDIDLSTLSRIERGKLNATLDTYYKIAKALEVPMHLIFIS
jgi:transcriptional regulator with XRE-family HTH domain